MIDPFPWMPRMRPAGQVSGWSPATAQDRDLVRACAQDLSIQNTTNCDPSMAFLNRNCRQVNGQWVCTGPNGQTYALGDFLSAFYGAPQTSQPPTSPVPPTSTPSPSTLVGQPLATPPATIPDNRLHPNDLELAQLRVQVQHQAQVITGLQITVGVVLVAGPLLTWWTTRHRRK